MPAKKPSSVPMTVLAAAKAFVVLKNETTNRTIEPLETTANSMTPTNKTVLSKANSPSPDMKRKTFATINVNVHMINPINNALEI